MSGPSKAIENVETIGSALQQRLVQSATDCPFVAIEQSPSLKFVQFTGSISEPLVMDLPSQTFSELEFYRAVAYFKRFGVAGQEFDVFNAPGGIPVSKRFSFQMTFDSIDAAVGASLEIFENVFGLPDHAKLAVIAVGTRDSFWVRHRGNRCEHGGWPASMTWPAIRRRLKGDNRDQAVNFCVVPLPWPLIGYTVTEYCVPAVKPSNFSV